ncbi:hypothetical protein HZS_6212 [Henneguya salminicola]|nr:hypothetical protein HZS_6212 [Henneguya salminicola]
MSVKIPEGTWNFLKYKISPRNATNSLAENGNITEPLIDDVLGLFQWMRTKLRDLCGCLCQSLT